MAIEGKQAVSHGVKNLIEKMNVPQFMGFSWERFLLGPGSDFYHFPLAKWFAHLFKGVFVLFMAQGFAHPVCQILPGERFVNKVSALVQYPMVGNDVGGVNPT